MKLLALIPVLLLTGCLSTPVKVTFPDIPEDLRTACPDLKEIEQGERSEEQRLNSSHRL